MPQPSNSSTNISSRRAFVRATIGGVAVATAGCMGGDDTSADGPVDAVESYFEALEDGDRERANEYAHEDGNYTIGENPSGQFEAALDAEEITLSDPTEVDLETAVENKYGDSGGDTEVVQTAIEQEREALETLQQEHDFEGYAYVRHEAETDGVSFNPTTLLFETEEGWRLWSLPTIPPLQVS